MKWIKRLFIAFILFFIFAVLFMFSFQEQLIFRSEVLPADYQYQFSTDFEELSLTADDGAVLNGLHFKQPNAKGVILYFHGNAQTLAYWGTWAETLAKRYQKDVVILDYRGYGKSIGKRKFKAMLDDGLLFYEYCKTKFSEEQITIFGRSLGGAFASHTAKHTNPKNLILESTFTSVEAIANKRYWFLPVRWLLKFPFQSVKNVQSITVPTYFIHGTKDRVVPYEFSQVLYKKSASADKQLFTIENGFHNDLTTFENYFEALDAILK